MKKSQDDFLPTNAGTTDGAAPSGDDANDERRTFAESLPINEFFNGDRERTFATLGRVTPTHTELFPWQLHKDSRKHIRSLADDQADGKPWQPYEAEGLSSSDLLAFAAEGSRRSETNLQQANAVWWKMRESSELWQTQKTDSDSWWSRLLHFRSRRRTAQLIADLNFSEDENRVLFKTEAFSRRTVYTRDYAAIPKALRALFAMVPQLVFAPRTKKQLSRFVSYANAHHINITPRGRGTWALGGALLTKGGVVLEMASFEKKIKVDAVKKRITVSASVDFQEAEEALNRHNLTLQARPSNQYGVVSGFVSVGEPFKGGLGLNAFGSGHIQNSVASLRVSTPGGEERLIKNEPTDFPYYFGTNGRYGIITEVTLKAVPKPKQHYPVAVNVGSCKAAFDFLLALQEDLQRGSLKCKPVHVEFFGRTYLDALKKLEPRAEASAGQLISETTLTRSARPQDTVLFVFYDSEDESKFRDYVKKRAEAKLTSQSEATELWEERFSPMKLRKKGDLLTAEVILPLDQVEPYLKEITALASKLGVEILPVAYILNSSEALVLPQFLTDHRHRFQYYRHFSLVPVLARRAIRRYRGRPYGYGIWFSGLAHRALGSEFIEDLERVKDKLDPNRILNPGKVYEIRSRLKNVLGRAILHEYAVDVLDVVLRVQTYLAAFGFVRKTLFTSRTGAYEQPLGDAMHRCIKCSACMVCPLAQIWEKSGDPKLMSDAIYITPRFKMEYMQRHLYERQKLSQADVDRFVLCFRCGVAERETVCPISDLLLDVDDASESPCQKKLPTYDDFEEILRKDGYDVDGAVTRYMDILRSHPGVALAMKQVLGNNRVQKSGDFNVLKPKTDFAVYQVDVDEDRCINCGKCGDEHTTSQRGFWDPRHPRKMVSLDDLMREMDGKIPKTWFDDAGGPIPQVLKSQGDSNGEAVYFSRGSELDLGHQHCNGCLYCVIECPTDAIRVTANDYYTALGGQDFTAQDVRRINEESRTGGVPTSGTGSTGLFGGIGYDRYMFDFSVIVRPTRDGIREAIDIGVNLGRKPLFHLFENNYTTPTASRIKTHFQTVDLPTPILLELPTMANRKSSRDLIQVFLTTAFCEKTRVFITLFQFMEYFEDVQQLAANVALRLYPEEIATVETWLGTGESDERLKAALREITLVEVVDDAIADPQTNSQKLKQIFGGEVVVSHLLNCPFGTDPNSVATQVLALAKAGAEIINLKTHFNTEKEYHESVDMIPQCYNALLASSLHTQVTLISNGVKSPADLGIAMMLGAGAVVLDRVPLVALNHEFPMLEKGKAPLPNIDFEEGLKHLRNLFKSWHKQISEVLGAFGIRDIRRTVGEAGRLIDLREREKKMRSIVQDQSLLELAKQGNASKIAEEGEIARQASWTYSGLSDLINPVPPPNANLLGERKHSLDSMLQARGDRRWNADVLTATWAMATGSVPSHEVAQTGQDFGGGSFDLMKFAPTKFEGKTVSVEEAVQALDSRLLANDAALMQALDSISISAGIINKHRRPESEPYVNHFPIDAADMSLGSIGWKLTLARYLAGTALRRYTGTGEGGYPLEKYERLNRFFPNLDSKEVNWLGKQMERWVATQTATGYFGVTEDSLRRAKKIVLKFAQGAKPGLGGHILGAKVTSQVEDLRGVIAGISVFSPFPFHDVYSIEDVTKMIEWLRTVNPDAIITVKISTPVDVYHVALGLVTGGVDEIQIDATAGGTGAAPDIARNRIAMPLEYGLSDVHKFLTEQGERNKVTLVASGGIRTAHDMAKALILGADKVVLGTQEIVAQQCNRCGNCEAPGGCQKGITTTVEQLEEQKEILLNTQWLLNSQVAVMQHVMKMMHVWGLKDIRELRGRTDLISEWGWETNSGPGKTAASTQKKVQVVNNWDGDKEERKELDACGVVSFACTKPVPVESIQTACQRMHNRGNGRGGGILGLGGMFSADFADCYAIQIITLAPERRRAQKVMDILNGHFEGLEIFDRSGKKVQPTKLTKARVERHRNPRRQKQGRDITWQEANLEVDPGDMFRFFVRAKKSKLLEFAREVLNKSRIPKNGIDALQNGHATNFLQNVDISGKWIDYFVKYADLLTDKYLDQLDPKSRFWEDPAYSKMWQDLEDEYIYRCAFGINQEYYIDPEEPEAFVSSMMKDGGIWKLVGYAEQSADYWIVGDAQYETITGLASNRGLPELERNAIKELIGSYQSNKAIKKTGLPKSVKLRESKAQLEIEVRRDEDETISIIAPREGKKVVVTYKYGAHVWIGHQRFPTVFSPYGGGSHPFYGRVYEALIHNGDFANYVAMVRFWDQFGGAPQFRTDTEMAAKAYAILKQMGYPQSHIIEAIAPTTGIDMKRLKKANPELAADFEAIQKCQVAGSPDGPWFFIIADQDPETRDLSITGLTDTSVLRPSVFVWQNSSDGKWASIGLVGSEEQACRSVLDALYAQGVLASREPDSVRIVRGGSVDLDDAGQISGGGAISYKLKKQGAATYRLDIADKFGNRFQPQQSQHHDLKLRIKTATKEVKQVSKQTFSDKGKTKLKTPDSIFGFVRENLREWQYNTFAWLIKSLADQAQKDSERSVVITALTLIKDRIQSIDVGDDKKRASLAQIVLEQLDDMFDRIDLVGSGSKNRTYFRLVSANREVFDCKDKSKTLVVDASDFAPEGHTSLARTLISAYTKGWRKFIIYRITGQRYLGSGFGPNSEEMEMHLYGGIGQDIANSMMGGTVYAHGDAQNDMAKIIHSGTVVVHGLAGNTGIYGAKGGEVYIRDSVGTRWVINSVSSPAGPGLKVVIVGAAMEYLAESLMGGKVLSFGLEWDDHGILRRKFLPFAGNSILAGASSGLVIIYDPDDRIEPEQYSGAADIGFLSRDWIAVYKNLQNQVERSFSKSQWLGFMDRWHSVSSYILRDQNASVSSHEALNRLIDVLKRILDDETAKLQADATTLESVVNDTFTGKEWRTLVRQLGQILENESWKDGLDLLDRMMDWREVTDSLKKADEYFGLGLVVENGWLYLPIDGVKTEIKREDFKVLVPLPAEAKEKAEKKQLLPALAT